MALCYVLIHVELGSEEKALGEVRKIPQVKECHRIYGVYDMIAKIEADTLDAVRKVVTLKIRRMPGVRSTLTTIATE